MSSDESESGKRSLGEISLPEAVRTDADMLKRYVAFSAEVVRLALAGIGGIGFLIGHAEASNVPLPRLAVTASIVFLAAAIAAGLAHRYVATDAFACHVRLLRLVRRGDSDESVACEKRQRDFRFKLSPKLLAIAAACLGLGAIAAAISLSPFL
jgi:hypothetical protein